jgi:hypothetical protein
VKWDRAPWVDLDAAGAMHNGTISRPASPDKHGASTPLQI